VDVRKTHRPGDRGTERLLQTYGERLIYVRCRFDSTRNKNVTTFEIVLGERNASQGDHALKFVPSRSEAADASSRRLQRHRAACPGEERPWAQEGPRTARVNVTYA
jgi:hypothetical protein